MIGQPTRSETYLAELAEALDAVDAEERAAILEDIRSHLAEAEAQDESIEVLITKMGSPKELARAFIVESALSVDDSQRNDWLKDTAGLVGAVAFASLSTLLTVLILGGLGLSLLLGGVVAIGATLMKLAGLPFDGSALELPSSPSLALLSGVLLLCAGVVLLWLVYRYLRVTARAITAVIPQEMRRGL